MANGQSLPSLDWLLKEIPPAALERPCTNDNFCNLARDITDWKELAPFLGLNEVDENLIEEHSTSPLKRRVQVLRKWKEKCTLRGKTASYKELANVFWTLGKADLVEMVGREAAAQERLGESDRVDEVEEEYASSTKG